MTSRKELYIKYKGFCVVDCNEYQFLCICQIFEKKWEYIEALHLLFIDFKKAYDSVRREVLCKILIEFGIHRKLVRLIKMSLTERALYTLRKGANTHIHGSITLIVASRHSALLVHAFSPLLGTLNLPHPASWDQSPFAGSQLLLRPTPLCSTHLFLAAIIFYSLILVATGNVGTYVQTKLNGVTSDHTENPKH